MRIIERKDLLNQLLSYRNTPDIKIITGVRRSGKSELVKEFLNHISTHETNPLNIVYIDLTDLDFEELTEYHSLHSYIKESYHEDAQNILCIDEIQMCPEFEKAINSIHSKGLWDIYLTGSNAFLLSSDLATLFTGRYIDIHVLPFSFNEYRSYFGQNDIDKQFDEYVQTGGMSGAYSYLNQNSRRAYISNIYNTILNKDLTLKRKVTNEAAFNALSEYLMDNVGNLTTINNVSNILKSEGLSSSHITVGNYIQYLCESFLFYKVKRYDIKGKRYLKSSDKYYLVDPGFRWAILGTRNLDYGHMYENIVAIELIRRGWDIYVGKLHEKEIDFVAMRGSEKVYIQVSDDISNQDTLNREVTPLLHIKDAYPKILIARTKHETYSHLGIKVVDIARWLANSEL